MEPNKVKKIKQADLHHGSDYTPYENLEIKGWPVQTWLRGQKIYEHNKFITGLKPEVIKSENCNSTTDLIPPFIESP